MESLWYVGSVPLIMAVFVQTLNLAWKSTKELKKSKAFVEVLKFVLAIGNYLNFGTRQGAAYGYKLSVLPKVVASLQLMSRITAIRILRVSIYSGVVISFFSFLNLLDKTRRSPLCIICCSNSTKANQNY